MDFKEWARDYGISQDFDLDDAVAMLEEYEKYRAKLSTNSDYTAALRAAIEDFFGMFSNKCLHENNMDRLATRLNSVVKKQQQNCA